MLQVASILKIRLLQTDSASFCNRMEQSYFTHAADTIGFYAKKPRKYAETYHRSEGN